MNPNDMLSSGVSDELLGSSANDLDENLLNEELENEDEDQENDQDQGGDGEEKGSESNKQSVDWKKKFHSTVTGQNRVINELKQEINQMKNKGSLTEDEIAKIKEKYDEDDLNIIEKIIERKANEMLDNRSANSLAQKELNILLKEYPELTDPEIKHIRSLQKEYGYSLKKAHSILFGRGGEQKQAPNRSVSSSFNGSPNKSQPKGEDKEYSDMEAFL